MTVRPRFAIGDVDGTLAASQADNVAAMAEAVAAVGRHALSRAVVLAIVGLSRPMPPHSGVPDLPARLAAAGAGRIVADVAALAAAPDKI